MRLARSSSLLLVTVFLLAVASSSAAQPTFQYAWGSLGSEPGEFDRPWGLAIDREGFVYVSDQFNERIQKFTLDGTFVSQWGEPGSGPGQFYGPLHMALGPDGYLYVVEHGNHRVSKFTRDGEFVEMWGSEVLYYPVAICIDSDGIIYVCQYNPVIQKFTLSGAPVGTWEADGIIRPYGLACDPDGNILVADHDGGPIRRYTSSGAFLGTIGFPGIGSAPGQFDGPHGMRFNQDGDLFVADLDNDRIQQFDTDGNFITTWGTTGILPGQFAQPIDVAFDTLGRIFVSDYLNARIQVFEYLSSPPPPLSYGPVLTDVRDVPHDQGGRVFVTWLPSPLESSGIDLVTGYRVWRRIHPAGTLAQVAVPMAEAGARRAPIVSRTGSDGSSVTYWEALVELPAQSLEGYGYTAATTQDSLHGSNPYSAFFVTALTADPTMFFSSEIDSGYSVDNLPPHGPGNLAGAITATGYSLTWDLPDPGLDPDVMEYSVYRGTTTDFPMDEVHLLGTTVDAAYVDPGASGALYYKVTATDVHGNSGPAATLEPAAPVDAPRASMVFALRGASPNPGQSARLMISFSLPNASAARLELFDTAGRRTAERAVGTLGAGPHRVNLAEGRALQPGLYAVRLTQGGRSLFSKVIVTR